MIGLYSEAIDGLPGMPLRSDGVIVSGLLGDAIIYYAESVHTTDQHKTDEEIQELLIDKVAEIATLLRELKFDFHSGRWLAVAPEVLR